MTRPTGPAAARTDEVQRQDDLARAWELGFEAGKSSMRPDLSRLRTDPALHNPHPRAPKNIWTAARTDDHGPQV